MDISLLQPLLHRSSDANKYDFGHVLVVGGSAGLVGAPLLVGEAALRIGAGLVTIASDARTVEKLERRVEEIMTLGLPDYSRVAEVEAVVERFVRERHVSVLVVGAGLSSEAAECVRRIIARMVLPIVLDAGGLAAFAGYLDELEDAAKKNPAIILTPHTGEYIRLNNLGNDSSIDALRKDAATFATRHNVTIALKGDRTFVVHPDGSTYSNMTGNPGLATAGTGDVLSGVIGGFLAQGVEYPQAVELGVYLHGLAGDLAASAKTQAGVIASDVIEFLPEALKKAA